MFRPEHVDGSTSYILKRVEQAPPARPVNMIRVDDETAAWALTALERMLAVR